MKKPQQQTPAQELQFWTAVIRGARDIERRALVEMQRITDAIEGSSRRQPKTNTTAAKEKPEWTAERREQQARRMRQYWKKRRAAQKATRRPRAMSAAGTA